MEEVPKEYAGGDVRLVCQQPISFGGFFLLDCSLSRQVWTRSGVIGIIIIVCPWKNMIEWNGI
jgi:hypothetical protein